MIEGILPRYQLEQSYSIAGPALSKTELFINEASNNPDLVGYVLQIFNQSDSTAPLTANVGEFFVAESGKMLIKPTKAGKFTTKLIARDSGGQPAVVKTFDFEALPDDTLDPANGPGGKGCGRVQTEDLVPMDGKFTCNCNEGKVPGTDGECHECLLGSHPNALQTDCEVDECVELERSGVCTCQLINLTDTATRSIAVTCNGAQWTVANAKTLALPPIVTQLRLQGIDAPTLPAILKELSANYDEECKSKDLADRQAKHVCEIIVEKDAITANAVSNTANISSSASASTSTGGGTDGIGVAAASMRSIEAHSICSINGDDSVKAVTDVLIPIGICKANNANDCGGEVCPIGEFADLTNAGVCTTCERGGFYADTDGRIGSASHCACSPCKNGTWASVAGASDPNAHCEVCPSGTKTDAPAGYRACACLDEFSRTDRFGECSTCTGIVGIACIADARVLTKGYFWVYPTPDQEHEYLEFTDDLKHEAGYNASRSFYNGSYPPVYACPFEKNCLGVTKESAAACLDGTTGVLCAVCAETHYQMTGNCVPCPSRNVGGSMMLTIFIGVIFILAFRFIVQRSANEVPQVGGTNAYPPSKFMTILKIMLSFTQVKSMLVDVYPGVPWPTPYRSFISGLQILSSNPMSIVMPSCLSPALTISAYGEFIFAAVVPIVIALIIYAYYRIKADASQDINQLKAVCISTASLVFFLLYPTITVSSVHILAPCQSICSDADENNCIEYLRADYSIQCGTGTHTAYKVMAGFALTLYGFGVPGALAAFLYRDRSSFGANDGLYQMAGVANGASGGSKITVAEAGLSFYSKQYKPDYYYWETVDLYRKLFVTSIVVFIADGTALQTTYGIIFSLAGKCPHTTISTLPPLLLSTCRSPLMNIIGTPPSSPNLSPSADICSFLPLIIEFVQYCSPLLFCCRSRCTAAICTVREPR
jgi:hypothetical protein